MTRDMAIYGRAGHLMEIAARRFRLGHMTYGAWLIRRRRISLVHHNMQQRAGATDYQPLKEKAKT